MLLRGRRSARTLTLEGLAFGRFGGVQGWNGLVAPAGCGNLWSELSADLPKSLGFIPGVEAISSCRNSSQKKAQIFVPIHVRMF